MNLARIIVTERFAIDEGAVDGMSGTLTELCASQQGASKQPLAPWHPRLRATRQIAKFALKLKRADLAADLAGVGLEDADVSIPVNVPVAMYFNGEMFQKSVGLSYKAKKGKTGSAK